MPALLEPCVAGGAVDQCGQNGICCPTNPPTCLAPDECYHWQEARRCLETGAGVWTGKRCMPTTLDMPSVPPQCPAAPPCPPLVAQTSGALTAPQKAALAVGGLAIVVGSYYLFAGK